MGGCCGSMLQAEASDLAKYFDAMAEHSKEAQGGDGDLLALLDRSLLMGREEQTKRMLQELKRKETATIDELKMHARNVFRYVGRIGLIKLAHHVG